MIHDENYEFTVIDQLISDDRLEAAVLKIDDLDDMKKNIWTENMFGGEHPYIEKASWYEGLQCLGLMSCLENRTCQCLFCGCCCFLALHGAGCGLTGGCVDCCIDECGCGC